MTSIRLKIEESWYASMDCKVQKSGPWVCFYGGHSTGYKLGNHPKNIEPCAHRARTVRAPCAHRATTPPEDIGGNCRGGGIQFLRPTIIVPPTQACWSQQSPLREYISAPGKVYPRVGVAPRVGDKDSSVWPFEWSVTHKRGIL